MRLRLGTRRPTCWLSRLWSLEKSHPNGIRAWKHGFRTNYVDPGLEKEPEIGDRAAGS